MAQDYDNPTRLQTDPDKASEEVINRYTRSRRWVEARSQLRADWFAAFRNYLKVEKTWPFRSRLVPPLTWSRIAAHLPRLAAARPRIEVWGRGTEDARRAAAHRALCFFFWDLLRMDVRLVDYLAQALVFGTGWWKVTYRRSTRLRKYPRMVPVEQPRTLFNFEMPSLFNRIRMERQLVEVPTRTFDGPWVDLVDPDDLFFDEDGVDEDDCGYIIHRQVVDLQALEDAIQPDGSKLYDEDVLRQLRERMEPGNPVNVGRESITVEQRRRDLEGVPQKVTADEHKRQGTLLEEWRDDKVTTVVMEFPDLPPIRNEMHNLGMKPFIRYTPIPIFGQLEGRSMAEDLFSIQFAATLLTNGMMDHLLQSVHAMHTVRKGSGLQQKQIRFRPSGVIPVRDHDDVRPLETAPLDFTHYREMDFLRTLADDVSGASEPYRGLAGGAGQTATQSSILAQSAASRVGLMFQLLGSQPLHRLAKLWIRMSELYFDKARTLRILGDEFADTGGIIAAEKAPGGRGSIIQVTPEDLLGGSEQELDLVIDVAQSEPGTRQFRLQRATTAIQSLGQRVPPGSPLDDRLMEGLLEGLGEDRPDLLIQQQHEWIAQQQQAAAQAQAQQQGQQVAETRHGPNGASVADELGTAAAADAGRGDQL